MAASPPVKGILKPSSAEQRTSKTPVEARQLAVHHANILHSRKNLEASILDSIQTLSEFPPPNPSGNAPPATDPSPADATSFKDHVRLFQPSDYDDLVEERNVNDLCGYALCPNPKPSSKGGQWTLRKGQIVNKHELEKWCSESCRKAALYIKVQLSETAAWERVGIPDIKIELLGEESSAVEQTARELGQMKLADQRHSGKVSSALALERGEQEGLTSKMKKLHINITEKDVDSSRTEFTAADDADHLQIEGHRTGDRQAKKRF